MGSFPTKKYFACESNDFMDRNFRLKGQLKNCPFLFRTRESREQRGVQLSAYAEHVTVLAAVEIINKPIVGEAFVVKVYFKRPQRPFKVVALVDDVTGEVFFAIPMADEIVEFIEAFLLDLYQMKNPARH